MKNINKDFSDSIIKSNEVLNIVGKVLPVTLDEMNITAELQNGYLVTEKSKIAEVVYEKVTKINLWNRKDMMTLSRKNGFLGRRRSDELI